MAIDHQTSAPLADAGQPAWLLNLGHGLHAAIGHLHLVHLLPEAVCESIPHSPPYCHQVTVWQGRLLPVMDLALRIRKDTALPREPGGSSLLGVIAFQSGPGQVPNFGTLTLASPAQRIMINNGQAADLPGEWLPWRHLCLSCFDHPQHGAIPILNIPAIFSAPDGKMQ